MKKKYSLDIRFYLLKHDLDKKLVGTRFYMGLCYFWNIEYKHYLRDATYKERKEVHKEFIKNKLDLVGVSNKHLNIIKKIIPQPYTY